MLLFQHDGCLAPYSCFSTVSILALFSLFSWKMESQRSFKMRISKLELSNYRTIELSNLEGFFLKGGRPSICGLDGQKLTKK